MGVGNVVIHDDECCLQWNGTQTKEVLVELTRAEEKQYEETGGFNGRTTSTLLPKTSVNPRAG